MMLFSFMLFLTITLPACQSGDSNDPDTSNNPDPTPDPVPDPDRTTHELFTEGDNVVLNPDFMTVILQGIEIRNYQSDDSVKYTDETKIPGLVLVGGSAEIDIETPVNSGRISVDGDMWIKNGIFEDGGGNYISDNNLIVEGTTKFSGTENDDYLRLHAGNILYVEEAIKGNYEAWNTAIIGSMESATVEAANINAENVSNSVLNGLSVTVNNFGGAIQFDSRDVDRDIRDGVANNTNTRLSGIVQGGSLVLGKLLRGGESIDLSKIDSVQYNDVLNVGGGWDIDPDKIQITHYSNVYVDAQHLAVIHIYNLSGNTTVVTNDPHLDVATARNVYGWWGVDEVINVDDLAVTVSDFFD